MAFRKKAFQTYGLFRNDLGPTKESPMGKGEDTEFSSRLLSAGETVMYAPDAIVYHPVEKERMHKEYFTEWFFNLGRAAMIRSDNPSPITTWIENSSLYTKRIKRT